MLSTERGYEYAQAMDRILDKALKDYPVSDPENYKGYAALLRTIQSTLDIVVIENNRHLPRCPACGKSR